MSNEADIFDQCRPEITEQEAIEAGRDGRIIQSFDAHPISNADGTIPALAIKLTLTNGAIETVLIGQYAALIIRMMISELEASHWTELATLERMRDQTTNAATMDFGSNILNFRRDAAAALRYDTSAALDLVSEAAGVIRGISDRAADSEARAKASAESALERLQLAEARIYSAEAARDLAEESLSKLSVRLEEAKRELTRTQSRIETAEAQLAKAEQRMSAAERRAVHAEEAVHKIEEAIRTQLVGFHRDLNGESVRAA
jgi:DNA repair exonuclease SbcCD ATPase subunit